jgi:ABC-type oligopeptide transport system substrate-binding subunit
MTSNHSGANLSHLAFFYPSLSAVISTDILEIETYSNNLVVAPTIGNLVTYFSDERPTPYLAKSWRQEGNKWFFDIREGLKCEDGEEITAKGFAKSLARSIRLYSQGVEHPLFKNLKGYKKLVENHSETFEGIYSNGSTLVFEFETPVRGGFLEHLTMAPFGYICDANYDGDKWRNSTSIVSSGPYSLNKIVQQSEYTLKSRNDWPAEFKRGASTVTVKRAGLDEFRNYSGPKIIEAREPSSEDLNVYAHIKQIPQNLIIVKLNTLRGAFSKLGTRKAFLQEFRRRLDAFPYHSTSTFKTDRFFGSDTSDLKIPPEGSTQDLKRLNVVLKVMLRGSNTPNEINKSIIQNIASTYDWNLSIDSEPYDSFRETYQDPKYDIYVQAAEIGGGFESWAIDMLFCSDVGDRWPDPSGRICVLTKKFNSSDMSIQEATQKFQDYLIDDAAVIPTFHRGGFYLVGEGVEISSLSPMVTRIRFEEIRVKE